MTSSFSRRFRRDWQFATDRFQGASASLAVQAHGGREVPGHVNVLLRMDAETYS
jgi:hypothetical protein